MSQQTVMIQVRFTEDTSVGQYSDALYYSQTDYANIKQADIDSEKLKRVSNWVEAITNPPVPTPLTKQQLIDLEAQLVQAKIDQDNALDAQIADVQAQIAVAVDPDPIQPIGP